jgi:hypothetical protein
MRERPCERSPYDEISSELPCVYTSLSAGAYAP